MSDEGKQLLLHSELAPRYTLGGQIRRPAQYAAVHGNLLDRIVS